MPLLLLPQRRRHAFVCRVSESAAGAIQHVHESRWYKNLLPLVAPLADPAVKRIMNSPAFQVPAKPPPVLMCTAASQGQCDTKSDWGPAVPRPAVLCKYRSFRMVNA